MIEVTGKNYHQNNDATIISSIKNVESSVFFDTINRNKNVNYLSVNDRDNFYNFKSHISLSSDDTVIRNRFLNKIGIGITSDKNRSITNKMQQQQKPRYRYERANRHYENLKFNNKYDLEEDHNMPMQQENHHEKNSTINHNKEISNNDQHHHQQHKQKQKNNKPKKRVVNFNNK